MGAGDGPSWLTRRVVGWAMFDVASSTYAALVPIFFGLYFAKVVARGDPSAGVWWGVIAATGLVLAGVLAPIAGAHADRTATWFRLIVVATALCVLATSLLPFAAARGVVAAGAVFVVAQVGYTMATSVYDSLVVDVAPGGRRGRISALGWALGLLGGIVAIATALLLMRDEPAAAQVDRLGDVFFASAVLLAVLALPGFAGLRGLRPSVAPPHAAAGLAASLRAVGSTVRVWRDHRQALQVLLSFFLINDVLVTIQFFVAIVLSNRFGLTVEGLLGLSLLYHLIAIPSTLAFGALADHWGAKPTVLLMCATLAAAILLLAVARGVWVPAAAVGLLGLVMASTQAVFRSLYASQVRPAQAAELFGFNAVAGRLSAALGPLVFGFAAAALGSETWALFLLLLPVAAGVWLLLVTDLGRPRANGVPARTGVGDVPGQASR